MKTSRVFKIFVFLAALLVVVIPFAPVHAESGVNLPGFSEFESQVVDGQANIVRGVYVPGVLAYRVVQQPVSNPGYVSQAEGVVTQFGMAAAYQVTGLLAHNYLAGTAFSQLRIGDEVRVVYGDGSVKYYTITRIARYQALQPYSGYSNFKDLESDRVYTAQDVFSMYYQGGDHVTFQTCIDQDGISSWGRIFVVAIPSAPYMAEELFAEWISKIR
jgi:hypothetical protein